MNREKELLREDMSKQLTSMIDKISKLMVDLVNSNHNLSLSYHECENSINELKMKDLKKAAHPLIEYMKRYYDFKISILIENGIIRVMKDDVAVTFDMEDYKNEDDIDE